MRIVTAREQAQMREPWRFAMPAPTPPGLSYQYHPTNATLPKITDPQIRPGGLMAPAVTAHDGEDTVGYLSWAKHRDPAKNGEIGYITVHPDYRRHGVATGMMDHARQINPELHHSEQRTELGDLWHDYEQGRTAAYHIHETQPGRIWRAYDGPTAPHDPNKASIGKLVVDQHEGQPYVNWVSVDDKHRGQGIGQAMWEQAGRPLHVPGAQTDEGKAWADKVGGDSLWWDGNSHLREAVWRDHPWLDDNDTVSTPMDPHADIQTYLRGAEDAYDEYANDFGTWEQRVHAHPPDPTPKDVEWYHATYADLPVGTVLAPHKGEVPWLDNPYHGGLDNRANWTWVEYDLTHSDEWLGYMVRDHGEGHLYRVKPHIGPFPWNGDAKEGWVTDLAVIVERVRDAGGDS